MIMRNKKMMAVGAAGGVVAGVAVWIGSRPVAPPKATFEPGQAVIEDSEMSPKAFEARRRRMVESRRAGAAATSAK